MAGGIRKSEKCFSDIENLTMTQVNDIIAPSGS